MTKVIRVKPVFGAKGDNGWTAELAVVTDGDRRVQQVVDWFGGQGTKPDTGQYIGSGGFVTDIAQAKDIRGGEGEDGDDGVGIASVDLISTVGLEKTYRITFTDASTFDYVVTDGEDGEDGEDGNGIQSIQLISTVGLEKTYRITFTDATTFDYVVTDGEDGADGNGIQSIALLSTVGLEKTYRITFTDSTTFDYVVTDGEKGDQGEAGTIADPSLYPVESPESGDNVFAERAGSGIRHDVNLLRYYQTTKDKRVFFWDNFIRPNNTDGLGTATFGGEWLNLDNAGSYQINNNNAVCRPVSQRDRAGFLLPNFVFEPTQNNNRVSLRIDFGSRAINVSTLEHGVHLSKDKDNMYYFSTRGSVITFGKLVNGVKTELGSTGVVQSALTNENGILNLSLLAFIDPRDGQKSIRILYWNRDFPENRFSFNSGNNDDVISQFSQADFKDEFFVGLTDIGGLASNTKRVTYFNVSHEGNWS